MLNQFKIYTFLHDFLGIEKNKTELIIKNVISTTITVSPKNPYK